MWMDERVQVLQEYHFLQLLVLIEFKNSKEIQHSSQRSIKKKKKAFPSLFLQATHHCINHKTAWDGGIHKILWLSGLG